MLFPDLPDNFDALNDEDLATLLATSIEVKDKFAAHDPEVLGDLSPKEVIEAMSAGVTGILAMKAEQATRVEAQQNFAAEIAALNAQVEPEQTLEADTPDSADDDSDEPAEAAADAPVVEVIIEDAPVLEPVAASAAPKPLRRLPAAGRHQAITSLEANEGMVIRASAGLQSINEGKVLDEDALNRAFVEKMMRSSSTAHGVSENVVVASADITSGIPEFRRLREGDPRNQDKIATLVASAKKHGVGYGDYGYQEAEALTASGGICAPVTPYYQLAFISTMERPVRDSLVGFIADRGGIRYAPPPYLEQITTGVGIVTAAQDAAGGSAGTKTCQTLICPDFVEVDVDSIFHCFTGGNLGQRAFPEQASQFSSLILAQHARVAETNLLNKIKAGSTAVTGQSSVLGAISSLLNDILTAAAAYRSNNRMTDDAPLQVILPAWTGDLLVIDLINSQFQRFAYNQAGIEQLLTSFNIRVTWTLDGPTDGDGQVLARQGAGAMNALPTLVEWALFAPGSWLFVDSGVLELGIVRDSVLNATNSYQVFGESWESAAGIGVQSLWVTSTVCPSGEVAAPADNSAACSR